MVVGPDVKSRMESPAWSLPSTSEAGQSIDPPPLGSNYVSISPLTSLCTDDDDEGTKNRRMKRRRDNGSPPKDNAKKHRRDNDDENGERYDNEDEDDDHRFRHSPSAMNRINALNEPTQGNQLVSDTRNKGCNLLNSS